MTKKVIAYTYNIDSKIESGVFDSVKEAKKAYNCNALRINKSVFCPPIGYIKLKYKTNEKP